MTLYQGMIEQASGLLPGLISILVLGMVWIVIRTVFKLAMKVFMVGCVAIVLLGSLAYIFSVVSP